MGMVCLYAQGMGIPLRFRVDDDGLATVSSLRLSLRFHFREDSISIEEEIFDDVTAEVTHTLGQPSVRDENNLLQWRLFP